jgi:quercetin dioxygenase-like cupin family protein
VEPPTSRPEAGLREAFETAGHLPPRPVFSRAECRAILRRLRRAQAAPADWAKGCAVTDRAFYEVATHPPILDAVAEILGPDVLLWGAALAVQPPGGGHAWHSDIECAAAGPTVGVWLALDHVDRDSGLRLVSRTHRLDPIQRLASKHGVARGNLTRDLVLGWARELDPHCEVVDPDVHDGEALFFDGRLWHASRNRSRLRSRTALLLQYATPASEIRIPEPARPHWPFRLLSTPRPATIMVRGTDVFGENRTVSPPAADDGRAEPALGTRIQSLGLPLAEDARTGWRAQPIFRGSTPNVPLLSCHVSTLSAGATPHPLHGHDEEEVLVMLSGEMDLAIEEDGREVPHRVGPGQLVYYPAQQRHTIHNRSGGPATYVILKWLAPEVGRAGRLPTGIHACRFDDAPARGDDPSRTFRARVLFAEETGYLAELACHVSRVEPGGGYEPHVDAHDVAIVPLAGRFETGGETVGPGDVVFFAAGEPHGLRGGPDGPAEYLVFELHGLGRAVPRPAWLARLERRFGPWRRMPARIARGLGRRARHALARGDGRLGP